MEMKKITKLVLPVAGLGKRLRPLTFRIPKALVKVGGKPLLAHILEEARGTSIREVILIVSPKQKVHFLRYLRAAKRKFPDFKFQIRFQEQPLGTGHVLLQARDLIRGESFAVRNCDDILRSRTPFLPRLLDEIRRLGGKASMLTLRRVPRAQVSRFGVVAARRTGTRDSLYKISGIVEKPEVREAPSNLVILGAYVLTSSIMNQLVKINRRLRERKIHDALPITDAFTLALTGGDKIYGLEFKGKYLDCGTLENLKKADLFLKKARRD